MTAARTRRPPPIGRPRSNSRTRVFWWCWAVFTAAWLGVVLTQFPQDWRDNSFWNALMASENRILTVDGCGSVLDSEIARGCHSIARMSREREANRRMRDLTSAFASLGVVVGPPLAVLLAAALFNGIVGNRADRHPPARRVAQPQSRPGADIRLPPTRYRPPHRRHGDEIG